MYTVDKLALEPYVGSNKLEAKGASTGFATVKQKTNLVGLKLVYDAEIVRGNEVVSLSKGSVVFFTAETLHTADWPKKIFETENTTNPVKFILTDWNSRVVMVQENN